MQKIHTEKIIEAAFASHKHIVRNYYLFEEEEDLPNFSIKFRLTSGDHIGRIPAPVTAYGWNDSILVETISSTFLIFQKNFPPL